MWSFLTAICTRYIWLSIDTLAQKIQISLTHTIGQQVSWELLSVLCPRIRRLLHRKNNGIDSVNICDLVNTNTSAFILVVNVHFLLFRISCVSFSQSNMAHSWVAKAHRASSKLKIAAWLSCDLAHEGLMSYTWYAALRTNQFSLVAELTLSALLLAKKFLSETNASIFLPPAGSNLQALMPKLCLKKEQDLRDKWINS